MFKKVFLPVKGQEMKMKMDPQQLIYIYREEDQEKGIVILWGYVTIF